MSSLLSATNDLSYGGGMRDWTNLSRVAVTMILLITRIDLWHEQDAQTSLGNLHNPYAKLRRVFTLQNRFASGHFTQAAGGCIFLHIHYSGFAMSM